MKIQKQLKIFLRLKGEELPSIFIRLLKAIARCLCAVILIILIAFLGTSILLGLAFSIGWIADHLYLHSLIMLVSSPNKSIYEVYMVFGLMTLILLFILATFSYLVIFRFCRWIYRNWKEAERILRKESEI